MNYLDRVLKRIENATSYNRHEFSEDTLDTGITVTMGIVFYKNTSVPLQPKEITIACIAFNKKIKEIKSKEYMEYKEAQLARDIEILKEL